MGQLQGGVQREVEPQRGEIHTPVPDLPVNKRGPLLPAGSPAEAFALS